MFRMTSGRTISSDSPQPPVPALFFCPKVTLKKEYQNRRRQKNPLLVGGGAWYNLQAFRAVNQAVGRQDGSATVVRRGSYLCGDE